AGSLVPAGGRNVSRQRLRRRAPKYIGTHLVALLDIGTGHCRRVPLTLRRRREGPELLVGGFRLAFHLPQGVCPLLGQLPRSQRGGEYPSGRRILFGESVQRSHGELRAGQFAVLRFRHRTGVDAAQGPHQPRVVLAELGHRRIPVPNLEPQLTQPLQVPHDPIELLGGTIAQLGPCTAQRTLELPHRRVDTGTRGTHRLETVVTSSRGETHTEITLVTQRTCQIMKLGGDVQPCRSGPERDSITGIGVHPHTQQTEHCQHGNQQHGEQLAAQPPVAQPPPPPCGSVVIVEGRVSGPLITVVAVPAKRHARGSSPVVRPVLYSSARSRLTDRTVPDNRAHNSIHPLSERTIRASSDTAGIARRIPLLRRPPITARQSSGSNARTVRHDPDDSRSPAATHRTTPASRHV